MRHATAWLCAGNTFQGVAYGDPGNMELTRSGVCLWMACLAQRGLVVALGGIHGGGAVSQRRSARPTSASLRSRPSKRSMHALLHLERYTDQIMGHNFPSSLNTCHN